MKVNNWLQTSTNVLEKSGISTARLDALVLLEDITGKDRSWLLANPEFELSDSQLKTLQKQINLRTKHQPLAYIRGKTEFYGREFVITKDVLEPRPESEAMIDLLKDLIGKNRRLQRSDGVQGADEQRTKPYIQYGEGAAQLATQQSAESTSGAAGSAGRQAGAAFVIADVGTGSGALAITAKLEMPKAELLATDIDPNCLKVAKQNAQKHAVDVELYEGDLIEPIKDKKTDILLCNLPYVPDDWQINKAAAAEPRLAIFGGPDGLDLYRKLFQQIDELSYKPRYILCESLPPQHKKLTTIAKKYSYRLTTTSDFIQLFKIT
jgi:release factor glutamine methyltransferase